jgi:hypothetical protein
MRLVNDKNKQDAMASQETRDPCGPMKDTPESLRCSTNGNV